MRPKKPQIIINLCHRADSRSRGLDRIRLFNRDRGWNSSDIVNARFVHSVQKLPHIWTEGFDVASLAFSIDRLECETRFAAAARAGDDCQTSQGDVDVYSFQVVLTGAANLDAIVPPRSDHPLLFPNLRTHRKQFQMATWLANFGLRRSE